MRADRLEREFETEMTWRPFLLHPEIPAEGIDRPEREHPEGYVNPIRALAEQAALPYQPSRHVPNSHRSLEAAEFAREQGLFDAYHRALFATYFGQGSDIGDVAVLTELAAASGLDADGLQQTLESGRYTRTVDQHTDQARQLGITGTPTFIFEEGDRQFALVGAQDYSVFENVARRMGAATRSDAGR